MDMLNKLSSMQVDGCSLCKAQCIVNIPLRIHGLMYMAAMQA